MIRVGIVPGQWKVGVYPVDSDPVERTMSGSRLKAETAARSVIDKLKRKSASHP
jgi:hypothetical protein